MSIKNLLVQQKSSQIWCIPKWTLEEMIQRYQETIPSFLENNNSPLLLYWIGMVSVDILDI